MLKILMVDDDEEDQLITRGLLRRAFGNDFVLDWVSSWDEAAQAIRRENHDAYLVDYGLGKRNGIELLREAGGGHMLAPIIMLTGADNRELDLAAQAAGASDYLVKTELTAPLLDRAIRYSIERKKVERELIRIAHFDPLTGLVNRSRFRGQLESDIKYAQRANASLAVLLLDLDHFKEVNDTLGHPAGDRLLKQVGMRLGQAVRDTDTVARLGGDEFAIIATHLRSTGDAGILAEKIIASLREPIPVEGHDIFVKTSIGITLCPGDGQDPDQILKNADLALYKAKAEGRENFQFYSEALNVEAQARKNIEAELRAALEHCALNLCYQPKMEVDCGSVVGAEALLRWRRQDGSWHLLDGFMPAAETSGLVVPLGEWALREACLQKRAWERTGLATGRISVNLSAIQLRREEFFDRTIEIIDASGVDPSGIEIEMTERAVMDPDNESTSRLQRLRERGVRLAIDDFGTGYSSLSRLKRLPVDTLKIDGGFVQDIETDPEDAAIVRAIVQLGASLALNVVAEGVETQAQLDFLRRAGCHQVQGPLFSEALDAKALAGWIGAFRQTPASVAR